MRKRLGLMLLTLDTSERFLDEALGHGEYLFKYFSSGLSIESLGTSLNFTRKPSLRSLVLHIKPKAS